MPGKHDFEAFLGAAWAEHAAQPEAVAQRLAAEGLALVGTEGQAAALAHITHHVHGEHLGQWQAGREALHSLAALPVCTGAAQAAVQRCLHSLAVAQGPAGVPDGLPATDRIRIGAMAAASLAGFDAARALALLQQAGAEAEAAALPAGDPAARALAANANNIAAALEDKPGRSAIERELMLAAAQAARRWWEVAGTWLEVERAEYRLAMSWLQAGDPTAALHHARACLATVQAHDGPAFERFYALESVALAARACGDRAEQAQATAAARAALAEIATAEPDDFAACQACQTRLDALLA